MRVWRKQLLAIEIYITPIIICRPIDKVYITFDSQVPEKLKYMILSARSLRSLAHIIG